MVGKDVIVALVVRKVHAGADFKKRAGMTKMASSDIYKAARTMNNIETLASDR